MKNLSSIVFRSIGSKFVPRPVSRKLATTQQGIVTRTLLNSPKALPDKAFKRSFISEVSASRYWGLGICTVATAAIVSSAIMGKSDAENAASSTDFGHQETVCKFCVLTQPILMAQFMKTSKPCQWLVMHSVVSSLFFRALSLEDSDQRIEYYNAIAKPGENLQASCEAAMHSKPESGSYFCILEFEDNVFSNFAARFEKKEELLEYLAIRHQSGYLKRVFIISQES